MNSKRFAEKLILCLLSINIILGLLVFRHYGYSWDEPLFYDYGDALGYAYSPREWFSGDFDLERSYGASGDDHKTRGPAYLLLARGPVYVLEAIGLDPAAAWHLINFLFFQAGVYFLYRLASRWMKPSAAVAASALFSWQPLLWGHAFINPKDPPFLVFFLASVCLGFEMVDSLANQPLTGRSRLSSVFLPAVVLGITTSIRVLGPLAGLLVLAYAAWKFRTRLFSHIPKLALYGIIAVLAMFVTWPFLWEDPLMNFLGVLRLMSDNPTNLSVLFGGDIFRAGELPRRYMLFMLATTLTEPVWPLFFFGIFFGYFQLFRQTRNTNDGFRASNSVNSWASFRSSIDRAEIGDKLASLTLVLLWFGIVLAYVFLYRPAMYDGVRHFLFILPPIFLFIGFAFEFLVDHLPFWLYAALLLLGLVPGIFGIAKLHPYEYTYYNSYIGSTDGAFRQYETDYWLTCYKEAVESLERTTDAPIDLYVHREAYIAEYYASEKVTVHDLRGALDDVQSGDYILVNTRTNEDRRIFKDVLPIIEVRRGEAVFCQIKQIP